MKFVGYYITLLLLVILTNLSAAISKIDSLKNANKILSSQFSGILSDTIFINSLVAIGDYYTKEQPDSAIKYYTSSINLIEIIRLKNMKSNNMTNEVIIDYKLGQIYYQYGATYYNIGEFIDAKNQFQETISLLKKHDNKSINTNFKNKILTLKGQTIAQIGNCNWNLGAYDNALKNYSKALEINLKINNKEQQAAILGNIGVIMNTQGKYTEALTYYFKSLKIEEEINNEKGQSATLGNIGIIYYDQKQYKKALEYYLKSLALKEKINETTSRANILGNIGVVYHDQNNFDKALEYYQKGLAVDKKYNNKYGISRHLGNIGLVYEDKKDFNKALVYYFEALKIDEELNNKLGITYQKNYIGNIYLLLKEYKKSEKFLTESYLLSKEIGSIEMLESSTRNLGVLYEETNKKELAYDYYKLSIQYKDSISNEENTKVSIEKELQYLYEKKSIADSLAYEKEKALSNAELARKNAEIKIKKNQQYFLFGGLFLIILFSIFMYNRYRVTNNQKHIIESQKIIVEQKNKEITDSITYAKRIQEAILPSRYSLAENIKNSFVIFKPKDVVSGDFYWLETIKGLVYFAAADCTGHGVPGAMVSVVCSNALSKALLEEQITETGKLLDRTRELVIERFTKSDKEVKDGMDISLCCIDYKSLKLQWSGANNPLWIIRNGELIEHKHNKQSIGFTYKPTPFTTHTIELQKDDVIYIFTDGFQDQFGGEKGKKYRPSQLKENLLEIKNETMENQKIILENKFYEWKQDLEQVDDVCIIGVKI